MLFVLALLTAQLPTIEEIQAHLKASPTSQITMEADISIVTTWTDKYSRFWGDFGPQRQTHEVEKHHWRGHYPMFEDRLLTPPDSLHDPSYFIDYFYDGKRAAYLSPSGKIVDDTQTATLPNPEGYIRNIWSDALADEITQMDAKVVGWVANPTFGQCLRISGELYRGEPLTFDIAPDYGWAIVRTGIQRKDIPLLTETRALKLVHASGAYFCAEGVEAQIHQTPHGPEILRTEKMFAHDFKARPFRLESFQKPRRKRLKGD